MKPIKAWAILNDYGELAVWDYRLPICWKRGIAITEMKAYELPSARVVRVEIREIVPKPKEKK